MFDISWQDPDLETVAQRRDRKDRKSQSRPSTSSDVSVTSFSKSRPEGQSPSRFNPFTKIHRKKSSRSFTATPTQIHEEDLNDIIARQLPTLGINPNVDSHRRMATLNDEYDVASCSRPSSIVDTSESVTSSQGSIHQTQDSALLTGSADSIFSGRRVRSGSTWSEVTDETNTSKASDGYHMGQRSPVSYSEKRGMGSNIRAANYAPMSTVLSPLHHLAVKEDDIGPLHHFPERPSHIVLDRPYSRSQIREREYGQRDISSEPQDFQALQDMPRRERRRVERNDLEYTGVKRTQPTKLPPRLNSRTPEQLESPMPVRPLKAAAKKPRNNKPDPMNGTGRIMKASDPEMMMRQGQIRRMVAAPPRIILERLKEEWPEIADPQIYRDLELEKHLWLLTAVRRLLSRAVDDTPPRLASVSRGAVKEITPGKVLSIYESQDAACFQNTFIPFTELHHLDIRNNGPKDTPGASHLGITRIILPYPDSSFASISALNMPSLLPSAAYPPLLHECHRLLNPGGSLHLCILDPAPISNTMGPCLRAWLDSHLLLNLERQFRSTSPGRHFPFWLTDAKFACERNGGVRRVTLSLNVHTPDSATETEDPMVKLVPTVLKMLWKHVWGAFVEGERWWWEDEEVVKECMALGTRWEYIFIEAIKQG